MSAHTHKPVTSSNMTLSARQRVYLDAMGIMVWESQSVAVSAEPLDTESVAETGEIVPELLAGWDSLERAVTDCTRCELYKTRTQTVFGVGNRQADIMIIGEAPGADEDRQGEPFVGRAGQLLNEMLKTIGLSRGDVYIANILKCRPPNNRDPKPEEAAQCSEYLHQQIDLIKPAIILAVGRIAAQRLLQTDSSLSRLRGRVHTHAETGIPLIATYHPAYLLRTPSEKRKAWEDLLFVKKTIESNS